MANKSLSQKQLTDIGHILRNVAQKHIGMRCYRDAITSMQKSIDKDMDVIWSILNQNGDNSKGNGNDDKTS